MSAFEFILSGMLAAATPFLLAALGEMIVERTGVLNLGLEGMMALTAAIAFIGVHAGYGHGMAFLLAALFGALISLLFGILVLGFRANQVAAGLATGILGLGLSALIGKPYESLTITGIRELAVPGLSDLPLVGGLFSQDLVVWLTLLLTLGIWWMFRATRLGLVLRAVGENPHAAHAIGIPVITVRLAAIVFGGVMAGLAGAYASTVYTPLWADGMIAGRGWIALALVVFGTWTTSRVFFGACLFGALSLAELTAQATGMRLSSQLLASLPYLVTIAILGIISSNQARMRMNAVASLGKPYDP